MPSTSDQQYRTPARPCATNQPTVNVTTRIGRAWHQYGAIRIPLVSEKYVEELMHRLTSIFGYRRGSKQYTKQAEKIYKSLKGVPLEQLANATKIIVTDSCLGTAASLDIFNDDTVMVVITGATARMLKEAVRILKIEYAKNATIFFVIGGTNDLKRVWETPTNDDVPIEDKYIPTKDLEDLALNMLAEYANPGTLGVRIVYALLPAMAGSEDGYGYCGPRFTETLHRIASDRHGYAYGKFYQIQDQNTSIAFLNLNMTIRLFAERAFAHPPLDTAMGMLLKLNQVLMTMKHPIEFLRAVNNLLNQIDLLESLRDAFKIRDDGHAREAVVVNGEFDQALRSEGWDRELSTPKPAGWAAKDDPSQVSSLGPAPTPHVNCLRNIQIIADILLNADPNFRLPSFPTLTPGPRTR